MFKNADRVRETSTTTGTGPYSLAGPVTGFRGFVAGVGDGNHCDYVADEGADFEFGMGLVTDGAPDTLARTAIFGSSNGGAAVNWGAGTRRIYCAPLAHRGGPILLDEALLAADAATIPLSWSGSYRRLELRVELTGLSASGIVRLQFNGDTGTSLYGTQKLILIGTAVTDAQVTGVAGIEISNAADVDPAVISVDILNIPGVRHPLTVRTARQDTGSLGQQDLALNAGLWNSTDEITSMTLVTSAGNYLAGTRAWVTGY